jgi:hypothetical protein
VWPPFGEATQFRMGCNLKAFISAVLGAALMAVIGGVGYAGATVLGGGGDDCHYRCDKTVTVTTTVPTTVTVPTTITETVTTPGSTTTVTTPGQTTTVTKTVTQPGTTVTTPGQTQTETVTMPATTVTTPAQTVTETLPAQTVTVTKTKIKTRVKVVRKKCGCPAGTRMWHGKCHPIARGKG